MGPPPYRQRFLTFLGLREELARRCPDAEWFDLRFRDRIYVKHRNPPVETVKKAADRTASPERPPAPLVGPMPPEGEVSSETEGTNEPAVAGGQR
jgi:hypothetical protein